MRTVLVCFLAALAVSANVPKPYKGEHSYVYRFDSQVSSSLIGSTSSEIQQSASTRLRADVHITFTNDRHAKLQLQNIRLGEQNGELPQSQRVQPLEHFERRELPEALKKSLEMPLSVSYVDGVVERINFHEDDVIFAKNIKRAVLNLMQVNLKRNDVQGLKMQSSMPEDEQNENLPVFHVPEITLEGECETVYTIQKNLKQGEDERAVFNVSKSINFDKCQRTADVTYGYRSNPSQELRCMNCIRKQKPQLDAQTVENVRFTHCQMECQPNKINEDNDIERSTSVRFELTGKPDKFAIKRASMLSQYVTKGQNPASQNAVTQVVSLAELTFAEQSNDANKIRSFKQSSTDETLMYQPEWDVDEKRFYMGGDAEFEKNSPFRNVDKKEQKVAHILRNILKQWSHKQQGYELDTALQFNRLVETIRQSSVKEIRTFEDVVRSTAQQGEKLCKTSSEKECEEHAKSIFYDSLAVAATRNSLYVLADKIMKQELSTATAVQALQIFIANQHSPSEQQADMLERIAKHEQAHRSPALKQTAWLSFGAAVGAICQDKPSQGQKELFRVEELCTRGKKEQYKKTLVQLWKDADSVYEQTLVLKTIGNAALDNMVEELREIAKEKRQPILIRMEAIDAMRRLRTSQPQKIRQVLLPIFQDQREQPEIRMAAFSMILYTHPEKPILDQLVFTVVNDKSQNVKSFVMTAMEALSKSPSSAEQEVANHMKAALKMVKIVPEEMRASRKYRVPIYVSERENTEEQNVFLGLASIVSPSNMIPIHLSASLHSALNGEATEENLKVSFSQKNLEQWYEKATELFFNDDEQNSQEGRRYSKDLRSMYSSLGIKSRRTGSYYLSDEESEETEEGTSRMNQKLGNRQPFGMIVLRYSDVDAAVIPISEKNMPKILEKVIKGEKPHMSDLAELSQKFATGHKIQKHISLMLGEKKTKIPTTAGLPLALIRQTSVVASIEAHLQSRYESDDLEGSRGHTSHTKLRVSGIATHNHKTEVWTPVLISGVETMRTFELNTPVEAKLQANNKKVEVKVLLPQEHKTRFFAVHTLPMTYTRQVDMDTQTPREPRVKAIRNWALEHTQREHHTSQQSEKVIQVEGHYHRLTSLKQIVHALYTTENNVHLYFNPSSQYAPKELTLRLSGSAFQKHSEHSRPEMDDFYSSGKGFKHIYEEDFENMDMEKDEERRSKLSSYSQKYSEKDAYKHQLRLEAEARTEQRTHKLLAEINGACDSRMKHCKIFVNSELSPMGQENQPWKMNAKIQTIMPEISREEEDLSQKQNRMLVKLDTEWGTTHKNQVNLRLQAEPTKKDMWMGQTQSQSQNKWSRFLNKVDMVAEYNLRPSEKHSIQRAYELLKAYLYWQVSTEQRQGDESLVRATIVIDPVTRRQANITVQTPQERVRAESVELPALVQTSALYRLERRPVNFRSFGGFMQSFSGFNNAQCRADERRVRTFDGVSYKAPLSNCWTVLAKDCSREEPRFVVLMKKDEEQNKLKIITKESTIELSGSSWTSDNQKLKVKVNGEQIRDEERLSEEGVEVNFNKAYVSKRGIQVEFDGQEAKIKVSGQYKNIQCGLCGHYNDEEEDVFRMSNNKRSDNLKEFHRSYALKNEECDESSLDKHYGQDSDEFSMRPRRQHRYNRRSDSTSWFGNSDEQDSQERRDSNEWDRDYDQKEGKNIQPKERTETIEYSHKICFSTEPVKRCPHGTVTDEEAETKEKKVHFFCLDRHSTDANQLRRQARQGQIVEKEGREASFVETVRQPTKCLAY